MANPLAELRAQLIAFTDAPKSTEAKSALGRALTADEVGCGRPQVDHLIAEGNRVHAELEAELEARYGTGSKN